MDGTDYYKKAQQFYADAQKKLKPGFFGRLTSNKQDRAEEAADLFKQAANFFRLAKDRTL